jgi:hypothetical protein
VTAADADRDGVIDLVVAKPAAASSVFTPSLAMTKAVAAADGERWTWFKTVPRATVPSGCSPPTLTTTGRSI